MESLDYIEFNMNGQEVNIDFNQPQWPDRDSNFEDCMSGKKAKYKNDLID